MARNFFAGDTGGKASAWEAATANIVTASSSIAKDALNSAAEDREEVSFNAIYGELVGKWKSQTDTLVKTLFGGGKDNIKHLTEIFKGGKMIDGKAEVDGWKDSNHTDKWKREKNIARAFYAAAIPAAWTANRPAPVVVDFGPNCEIDARDYFFEEPDKYNSGWRCPDGHSYILAGVRDWQQQCGPNSTPGDNSGCPPTYKWTLDILQGIGEIQEAGNEWGGVTVDDLIIG